MLISKLRSPGIVGSLAALGVALAVSACGGSSSSSSSAPATTTQAAAVSSSTTSAATPKPRLKTLSPRAGAHTGSNVTVKVALIGGQATGAKPFRYVLDGHTRFGSRRVIFHGVRPGQHRLIVTLAGDRAVRTQTRFVVKAPPPPPAPAPTTTAAPAPTTTAAPAPTTTAAPAPTTTAAPAPTTTAAPAPTTTAAPAPTTTSPPSGGGIPQGGGDGDGDNSGGPSDGDGNI